MVKISGIANEKDVSEALKGNHGYTRLANGIEVFYMGRLVHFEGLFDGGSQEVIEIPKIPKRCIVQFSGDDFSCVSIAEANAGFVKVPQDARGKKFVVIANYGLNNN